MPRALDILIFFAVTALVWFLASKVLANITHYAVNGATFTGG